MGGFKVESTETTYEYKKQDGSEQKEPAFMNSAFTEAAKVEGTQAQSVAESGSTNVTETLSLQPLTISETFYGYNIDDLRKFLLKPENPSVGNCRGIFFG